MVSAAGGIAQKSGKSVADASSSPLPLSERPLVRFRPIGHRCPSFKWEKGRSMPLNAKGMGNTPPHDINVVIEVPNGGEPVKYELDKASGPLFVDRFLYTPMRYPGNYGF